MDRSTVLPLRIGAWCVDPTTGRISREGESVRLEARTMRLLLCLAERAGEVVSIDDLLNQVWSGVIVTSDSVYQAVASLRRLLGDDPKQPTYIATVPRLGYRMVASVGPWTEQPTAPTPVSNGDVPAPTIIDTAKHGSRRRVSAMLVAGGALVLIALIVAFLIRGTSATNTSVGAAAVPQLGKSIAVMPFLDLTEEMDQEYFADGMSEELIDMLSKIPGLRVPARTSSFYFKDKQTTIADIAKTLGVAYVLEGSVRKSGTTLRVTAQLIRADNGYHVWSNTYDRSLNDILMVQDDIATEVKKALIASLEDAAQPATVLTTSPAYAAYFQARALRRGDRTKEQAQVIVDYLHQAIRLDPTYAPAWAELARALAYQSYNQMVPANSVDEEAHQAANRAILLDPKFADAHLALGIVRCYLDRDWLGAEREYRNVLALEPGSAEVFAFLSEIKRAVGSVDEALGLMQQAVELDPLDARYYQWLGEMNYSLGRLAEAEANVHKARDINPELTGYVLLGEIKLAAGDSAAALQAMQRETDDGSRTQGLALVYFAMGRKSEADAALANLETHHANDSAFGIARIHAYRKETDQAFIWLDRAVLQRDPDCNDLKSDPMLRNLRGDSRYTSLLQKMKLSE